MQTARTIAIAAIVLTCSIRVVAQPFSGGDGSAQRPYEISTVSDWQTLVNHSEYWDKHFILSNTIDFKGLSLTPVAPDTDHASALYQGVCFTGTLDGRGFALINAVINLPSHEYVGLFGGIGQGGSVNNLKIANINVVGKRYVGVLAGWNHTGMITHCSASGTVSGGGESGGLVGYNSTSGTITHCSTSGAVKGGSQTGGLAGRNSGTISYCYASGTVSGSTETGGLAGYNFGRIQNCYATGNVSGIENVGGLIGFNARKVIYCFATGRVTGTRSVGGLCGSIAIVIEFEDTGNFWDTETSERTTSAMGTGKTTAQMKMLSTFADEGWNFGLLPDQIGIWTMPEDSYPVLTWQFFEPFLMPDVSGLSVEDANSIFAAAGLSVSSIFEVYDVSIAEGLVSVSRPVSGTIVYPGLTQVILFCARHSRFSGGDGSAAAPYEISTVDNWLELAAVTDADILTKHFVLTNDIDFKGLSLTPVAPDTSPQLSDHQGARFTGSFDGRGFALRNAVFDLPVYNYVGLFGYIGEGGSVSNLEILSITVVGNGHVGILAGQNDGTISHCIAGGDVSGDFYIGGLVGLMKHNDGTISNCSFSGAVSGTDRIGGLVGDNYSGTISHCSAGGVVSGTFCIGGLAGGNYSGTISHCSASGAVNGNYRIGGLTGDNFNMIRNCYATGNVSNWSREASGLVGLNYRGKVIHCYATGKVTGSSPAGGLCGYVNTGTGYQDTGNFWDTETSEIETSMMGTGKTTAQMKTLSTFVSAGWDFDQTWVICEGTNYPRLRWQIPAADWLCPDGVGLEDLAYLAARWLLDDCGMANDCNGADLDGDGAVNLADFAILTRSFL